MLILIKQELVELYIKDLEKDLEYTSINQKMVLVQSIQLVVQVVMLL